MRLFPPVPCRETLLSLLREAFADNQHFEYRRVPWGENQYIHKAVVSTVIYILMRLEDDYRESLLDMVPNDMDRMSRICMALEAEQLEYRHLFKVMEPVDRVYTQYEFDFMGKQNASK